MFGMLVELLLIPDCPNERAAQELLRVALDDVGLARTPIRAIIVGSQQDAEQRSFVGSPTILLDGLDPFPAAAEPALACRIYATPDGPAGTPPLRELRRAIKRAAAAPDN